MSLLLEASRAGDTERVKQLLDGGASIDEKDDYGDTALMDAVRAGKTEVVKLLVDKDALVDERDANGMTALMLAIEKAGGKGHTDVAKLLLDKGALLDVKDNEGDTALTMASTNCHTDVAKLLLDKGAQLDVKDKEGDTALPMVVTFDEDQLGRMAAAQVHRYALQARASKKDLLQGPFDGLPAATAKGVLQLVRLAGFARDRARALRFSDPRSADEHQVLFLRLQLAAAACVENAADPGTAACIQNEGPSRTKARGQEDVQKLFDSKDGRTALEHAVQIEAKELLAQPVVQKYIKVVWRGDLVNLGWRWVLASILLLLNLLFLLPLVALVPALEPWLIVNLDAYYFLRLPVVKFYLKCTADLALALALTLIPAADLATAPVAPLLLVWVGSAILWEGGQLMAGYSYYDAPTQLAAPLAFYDKYVRVASSQLALIYDRLAAYWADNLNRVDATVLIVSLAALIAAVSADDSEDAMVWSLATATSLRAAAVFLLWFRLIRVLLISPTFIPYVLMFFNMLFGDLLCFLVLLLFLLVAFAASWTVLLEPPPRLVEQQFGDEQTWRWTLSPVAHLKNAGCADELGGVDILSTLLRLLEGALTGNDQFECARESTTSPLAQWAFSFMYVMLTTVLLLNMLIAMCAAA